MNTTKGGVADFGLILSEPGDAAAVWVDERLRARGVSTELVTSESLTVGAQWTHTVGRDGARFDLALADGRRLGTDRIAWVLNRLVRIPDAFLLAADEPERSYAEQEMRALLCSAVHSLRQGVEVVEPPNPYALAGRWRSPAAWNLLAAQAGLRVHRWRWHGLAPEWLPSAVAVEWVLVVGDSVLPKAATSPEVERACCRLAEVADVAVLQIGLTTDEGEAPTFGGVLPIPDLRIGGDAAVDALLAVLSR